MIAWSLFVILLLIVVGWIVWYRRARFTNGVSETDLERHIRDFVGYASFGGVLYIEDEQSKGFLQIAMRGEPELAPELQFGFPEMSWSRPHFGTLPDLLDREDYAVVCEEASEPSTPVTRFAWVRLRHPKSELSDRAYALARMSIAHFQMSGSSFRIRYVGSIRPEAQARAKGSAAAQ